MFALRPAAGAGSGPQPEKYLSSGVLARAAFAAPEPHAFDAHARRAAEKASAVPSGPVRQPFRAHHRKQSRLR
jgi:hypothetical protein